MSISKSEALRIIHNGALSYKNNLANKNVLFVKETKYCTLAYIAKGLSIDDEVFASVMYDMVDKEKLNSVPI